MWEIMGAVGVLAFFVGLVFLATKWFGLAKPESEKSQVRLPERAACGCPRNERGNIVHNPESCSALDSIIDNICG